MYRELRITLLVTLIGTTLCTSPIVAQGVYTGGGGEISFMLYHTTSSVTGNWICTASQSSALDTDGSGTVEDDECYASGPATWPNYDGLCGSIGVNSSLELQTLSGDKPGRVGNSIYHLVQSNNITPEFGGIPNIGPGRATDTEFLEGDNFILFKCPLSDPNCKNTSPVLVNATLRPNNPDCNPTSDPECDRHNWQLKSTNEFPPNYNKLEVWAKLQNVGVTYTHDDDPPETGQLTGTSERFFKDAVVVMNRTTTAVPFSAASQRQWGGPFNPQAAGQGWENALVWYMDNRWCDGSFGVSVSGGCPANSPLEARLIDIQVERRVFNRQLPDLSNEPDSGSCTVGVDCTLKSITADAVGFLNFLRDTDREVLAQNQGLCVDTVKGGVTTCANPTIPASCASRTNTSTACLPVTGCNCCQATSAGGCENPFLTNRSAYVIVDARKAVYFPEYNSAGTSIVGWAWVKWGKVLDEIPPLHPGISNRIIEVNVATTSSGGQEWQFWQSRGAGALASNPLPIAACDQSATSTQLPTAPFTTNDQISSLSTQQEDAWGCNVGTTDFQTLKNKGRVLKYGTFDPTTGVITTGPNADDSDIRLPSFTHPHMPTWYNSGITWLAGFLEVKNSTGNVTHRSISWGGTPQLTCNVANTTTAKVPGRAVMYERINLPAQ